MGVDRSLYSGGRFIANIGRTHRYVDLLDDDDIVNFKLEMVARMKWPKDFGELREAVIEFNNAMNWFIDEIQKTGASQLCDTLADEGVQIVDE